MITLAVFLAHRVVFSSGSVDGGPHRLSRKQPKQLHVVLSNSQQEIDINVSFVGIIIIIIIIIIVIIIIIMMIILFL